jgi:hypothetical protein
MFKQSFGQSLAFTDASGNIIDFHGFKIQCESLANEICYLRGLSSRLNLWFNYFNPRRADLRFQKVYLSLQVDDLLISHKQSLDFIYGMGVDLQEKNNTLKKVVKFKQAVYVIIAIRRMKSLAANWHSVIGGFVDQ